MRTKHLIIILILVIVAFIILFTMTQRKPIASAWVESDYQSYVLEKLGGESEYRLSDGSRVDILTHQYAIEIDYAYKWAEAIGQSLYYAEMSEREPGIVLILANRDNYKAYIDRILLMARKYKITVWTVDAFGNLKNIK
jgi:hypothetical protein